MSCLSPFTEWGHVFWASWCNWRHPCFYMGAQIEYQTHFHICIKCSSSKLKHSRNMPVKRVPLLGIISSVQSQSCLTLCDPMNCSTAGLPVHQQLPEFTQTHVHWVGDSMQPSHPLSSLLLLPPIPPSIRVFSNESALCMRWPKYWSFSFNISPSNEHPGLISFRMDWLDLLAVQGTLNSLLQHHSSKASIFQRSAFFTVQLSHPYMTTG